MFSSLLWSLVLNTFFFFQFLVLCFALCLHESFPAAFFEISQALEDFVGVQISCTSPAPPTSSRFAKDELWKDCVPSCCGANRNCPLLQAPEIVCHRGCASWLHRRLRGFTVDYSAVFSALVAYPNPLSEEFDKEILDVKLVHAPITTSQALTSRQTIGEHIPVFSTSDLPLSRSCRGLQLLLVLLL